MTTELQQKLSFRELGVLFLVIAVSVACAAVIALHLAHPHLPIGWMFQ